MYHARACFRIHCSARLPLMTTNTANHARIQSHGHHPNNASNLKNAWISLHVSPIFENFQNFRGNVKSLYRPELFPQNFPRHELWTTPRYHMWLQDARSSPKSDHGIPRYARFYGVNRIYTGLAPKTQLFLGPGSIALREKWISSLQAILTLNLPGLVL